MSQMADELVKVLLYFDVFSYPLTKGEIIRYSGIGINRAREAGKILDNLKERGLINYFSGFYFIGDQKSKVLRRIEGNRRAADRMIAARHYTRIIASFPFIRGVFLSGSISKGFMTEKDDIDYFVVTEPGRLWLGRTFLTLFKKIFLFNSHRNFCVNYFVDTEHLYISEQNRYTATEVVFLIPVYNSRLQVKILEQNEWVKLYYPDFIQVGEQCINGNQPVKSRIERLLDNSLGDRLERFLFKSSRSFIQRKFSRMQRKQFQENFKIEHYELRYLPERKQPEILRRYDERIRQFELDNGVTIGRDHINGVIC